MSELFAFEVPTSAGVFRIVGPETLPEGEAQRVADKIARLLPLLVIDFGARIEMIQPSETLTGDDGRLYVSMDAALEAVHVEGETR